MKCDKCGFEFDDNYDFCPKCGAQVDHITHEDETVTADNMHWDDLDEPTEPAVSIEYNVAKPPVNKKMFIIIGAVVLILLIVVAVSGNSSSKDSTTEDYSSTESYESDDDSYESDDYSDDYSYDSDSEMDVIQGSWSLIGVTNDGESVYVGDTPYSGSLDIYDDTWTMTINTTETTSYSGSLDYDYASDGYYFYNLRSSTKTGSVSMGYSTEKQFIVVSTQPYLDPDNNFYFSK